MSHKVGFFDSCVTVISVSFMIFIAIAYYNAPPHLPLLFGCFIAGSVSIIKGFKWEEIMEGMIQGLTQSLNALMILILIGILIAIWISSGTVPAMIYYGLKLLSPKYFLVSSLLICSLISMALGSWGAAGTLGIALMGIAQAMNISPALAAGAIISGSYVGDKLSPISDSSNLAAGVTGVNIFDSVKHMFKVSWSCYLLTIVIYGILGLHFTNTADASLMNSINVVMHSLNKMFDITPFSLLPLFLLLMCIVIKIPPFPSIAVGIISATVYDIIVQGRNVGVLFNLGYYGFVCNTGNKLLDSLLTTGGIESMFYSVSVIIIAMMFGGIMEKTGQMHALLLPLLKFIHGFTSLTIVTMLTCLFVNAVLPEQFISLMLTGRMYSDEYDRRQISKTELCVALGVGGSSTSALVPWNTCGCFMSSVLGVTAFKYAPYSFFNTLMPLCLILYTLLKSRSTSQEK